MRRGIREMGGRVAVLLRGAVERAITSGTPSSRLLTDAELAELAELLAAIRGTSDQLARALIRDYQQRVERQQVRESLLAAELLEGSYFAECPRDEKGRCLPRGGAAAAKSKTQSKKSTTPKSKAAAKPAKTVPTKPPVQQPKILRTPAQREAFVRRAVRTTAPATADELSALEDYAGNEYLAINSHLRGEFRTPDANVKRSVRQLDSLISKSTISEPVRVYRGIAARVQDVRVGEVFGDKGFVSTSMNADVARQFAEGLLLRINVPAGTNAVHVPGDESELLLPRGSRFKVTGVRRVAGEPGFPPNTVVDVDYLPPRTRRLRARRAAAVAESMQTPQVQPDLGRFVWRPADLSEESDTDAIRLDVPVVLQDTDYSCGAAALVAVARYYGVPDLDCQCQAVRELGTSPAAGTRPEAIVACAQQHGLVAEAATGLTVEDVVDNLEAGRPVIAAVQAYGDSPQQVRDADSGHYVVVIGYDETSGEPHLALMDPSSGYATVGIDDFERFWYDKELGGERYDRLGVAIGLPDGSPQPQAVATESLLHESLLTDPPPPFLPPEKAVEYFRSLVPSLAGQPRATLPDGRVIRFVPHISPGERALVQVPVGVIDAGWRMDQRFYFPPGAAGTLRPGTEVLEAPKVTLDPKTGTISVIDGRHRLAVLRDAGAKTVGVMVPLDELPKWRELGAELLGGDPLRVTDDLRRHAFTMAAATDRQLLDQVQAKLAERLQTGQGLRLAAREIDQLIDDLGVSQKNPQYAEMVVRTNLMDAYNQGAQDELSHPDVIDTFPVWRYANPVDGRSRPHHAARDGNYYPSSVPFVAVRGPGIEDAANCRCVPIPVDKWEWARLRAAGARIADGYPDVPAE